MERPLTRNIRPNKPPLDLPGYEKVGGYESLHRVLRMDPKEVIQQIKDSGLQGRGGAGFQTGVKMGAIPMDEKAPQIKYLIANADEMEPGTFKDRLLLEGDPHQLIEGMLVSAYAIRATTAYIFLRGEYTLSKERLSIAIKEAYEKGYLGNSIRGSGFSLELYLHTSAGRYICGEETALINALEGKRAIPRAKPPFPQQSGLFGRPTLVQNVETLCNLPHIINNGVAWYKGLSKSVDPGTKIYGVSGRVNRPGAFELPMGTSIRELLEEHAGGMQNGFEFRALLPGGASTDFLIKEHLDFPMDFSSMGKAKTRMGTGTMIVFDDRTCPVGAVLCLERFFKQESCGFCTPCREGLSFIEKTLMAIEGGIGEERDLSILEKHAQLLGPGSTFCALAPGASAPLKTALIHFRSDFQRHIDFRQCPYHGN